MFTIEYSPYYFDFCLKFPGKFDTYFTSLFELTLWEIMANNK